MEKKIIDYMIITGIGDHYKEVIETKIRPLIKMGWQPLAGISLMKLSGMNMEAAQVVVRYEKEQKRFSEVEI